MDVVGVVLEYLAKFAVFFGFWLVLAIVTGVLARRRRT